MEEILIALGAQHAELAAMLDGLDDASWARDSPCAGWTVAHVVVHLAQTDELAIGSLQGRFDDALVELAGDVGFAESIDAGAALMVERDCDRPVASIHDRWSQGTAQLRALLAASDPRERVTWVAGQLSVQTLAATRLSECWIHTGDVAAAVGRSQPPTDRLRHVARLAWRTVPYAFAHAGRSAPGPVAFELVGPNGDAWSFAPDGGAPTVIRGDAVELCLVAARRVDPSDTSLRGEGPDAAAVLELVRTYA